MLTFVELPVSRRHASIENFFRPPDSLKITSQDLFLQHIPRVPLDVPHFGHFFTPRRVARPRPNLGNDSLGIAFA